MIRFPGAWFNLCLLFLSCGAQAVIYRYQDAQGLWHFTDDPPAGVAAELLPEYERQEKPASIQVPDLGNQLSRAFSEAMTPIVRATYAVVTIESGGHEGSGFFCSEEGYILTNRHVIRPNQAGVFREKDSRLSAQERERADLEAQWAAGREQLQRMERDLAGYARVLRRAQDPQTRAWAQQAHDRLSARYAAEQAAFQETERTLKQLEKTLKKRRRDLEFARVRSEAATTFRVILKDGTEHRARLVALDRNQDLALLQLEGVRTPFLPLDPQVPLSQGQRVFAIGNPLGMRDSVTSGIITNLSADRIHTDVPILPGNSGGPLITEDGRVIGVNVAKDVAKGSSVYTVGFGKAIPIGLAIQAFPQLRR